MAGYEINDQVSLQLNGYNLTDELYVAALNNSGVAVRRRRPALGAAHRQLFEF